MSDKPLLEKCPNCGQGIGSALSRYFWSFLPGNEFEYTCPNCGAALNITVESNPLFYVTKKSDSVTKS
jgi:predicted RNA-binding Zn-ribbon protein involved in translation (DUF1610 family)